VPTIAVPKMAIQTSSSCAKRLKSEAWKWDFGRHVNEARPDFS
jgi:hypothetical protein